MKTIIYLTVGFAICVIVYLVVLFGYWYTATSNKGDTRNPACHIHEQSRITFQLPKGGYNSSKMLDSFKIINPAFNLDYGLADHLLDSCYCCCIDQNDYIEFYFKANPKEVYRVNQNSDNSGGFVDIVSTYKNGKWNCSLTSRLGDTEKLRIKRRFTLEILNRLPSIDTTRNVINQ